MRVWEKLVSKRGVGCHFCRRFIRAGKIYFQHSWVGSRRFRQYQNCCVECIEDIAQRDVVECQDNIASLFKFIDKAKEYKVIYQTEDEAICNSCKKKMRHITNMCHPKEQGCSYKEIKCGKKPKTQDTAVACAETQ